MLIIQQESILGEWSFHLDSPRDSLARSEAAY